jgi:DNA integrity scanning protein DisA with diadenylate cyclase activity
MKMNKKKTQSRPPTENRESKVLVEHCFDIARQLGISKLMVFAESITDQKTIKKCQESETIIWLSRRKADLPEKSSQSRYVIALPMQDLSRRDQFQIGLLLAVLNELIDVDETVLCMTGLVGSLRLDNVLITNLRRDNKWFRKHTFEEIPKDVLCSREFFRILDIALRFAEQGREGKAIGTTFVLGKQEELEPYLKQLILNPCKGHKKSIRNIHNPEFTETLRELSTLDGAFIVSTRGVVERAATYLDPPSDRGKTSIPKGTGARHASAAALTSVTGALAVVVSESSSSVTAFYDGSPILEINTQ